MKTENKPYLIINRVGFSAGHTSKYTADRGLLKTVRIVVLIITLLSACTTLPKSVSPNKPDQTIGSQSVYIVSHGWHTGIVYPRELLLTFVPELAARFPAGDYLEIGWGDKGFYQAKKITAGLALRAIFWPTDTVVHVVAVPKTPYLSFPSSVSRQVRLSRWQMDSLGQFLASSFHGDHLQRIVSTTPGIYGDSQFYVGVGNYHLFNTCNKWTAKGLESAGFDIKPILKLTASGIINYLDAHANVEHNQVTTD